MFFFLLFPAIREDRTRGGRSTYHCSPPSSTYPTAPNPLLCSTNSTTIPTITNKSGEEIPGLLREIMSVEHLWFWRGAGKARDLKQPEVRLNAKALYKPWHSLWTRA
ncbi:Uncharacterized protein FKW44_023356 [Caligus rogercresseyi]|uniref:Uncharacterized protein n=1 Tax=Caligus rogercresseyi TaxID=217165 RepID=A0A7T8JU71_CALRO|nr:Uncharacterized protein FKW44_023356 [Caligus rogercresseyi]